MKQQLLTSDKFYFLVMKKIFLGLCLLSIISCSALRKTSDKSAAISAAEIIQTLSSDEFGGRRPGTVEMSSAIEYIELQLKNMDINPLFNTSYRDTVSVRGKECYNLVGIINGNKTSDEYILLGAHLDHLGKIKSTTDSVYNGANDNASGVTAALKIAGTLKANTYNKNVILAIFTGEESGLIGSKHLAKKLKANNITLSYVINFEMIGKALISDASKVYITGFNTSDFAQVSNRILQYDFIKYEKIESDYGLFRLADNYPFYLEFNIPSHTISTYDFKNFDYYHDLKDEYTEIDIQHMNYVIDKTTLLVQSLLESDEVIKLKN